jgi:type IV secretory pathway VirB4 component
MTITELQDQINQAEQDIITLDYKKWSKQQRHSKLPTNRALWHTESDGVLLRQQLDNAESERRHLAMLDVIRVEKQREVDAEIDRELEPQKQNLMHEWLANNPDNSINDFNKLAWLDLRQNLIEIRAASAVNAQITGNLVSDEILT